MVHQKKLLENFRLIHAQLYTAKQYIKKPVRYFHI